MNEIQNCFYRVSIKALVLNSSKDKFLVCKKESGIWELPGGGLDWGTAPQDDLSREIHEEMGIETVAIAEHPTYFMTAQSLHRHIWVVNVIYETVLKHLDFRPSDECTEIRFVNQEDIADMHVFPTVKSLTEIFDPKKHT